MIILSILFFIIAGVLAYWLWIRPLLKARPQFAEFYAWTDSFWKAIWLKLSTIKTKLSATLVMIASGIIALHDFLIPIATGIDWSPITGQVPPWVWPIVSFAIGALFLWLRTVTAKTQAKEIEAVAAGATLAEAKIEAGIMPGPIVINADEDVE